MRVLPAAGLLLFLLLAPAGGSAAASPVAGDATPESLLDAAGPLVSGGALDEAGPILLQAAALPQSEEQSARLARMMEDLFQARLAARQGGAALQLLRGWVAAVESKEEANPREIAISHLALGRLYLEAGAPDRAVPLLRRVIELGEAADRGKPLAHRAHETLFLARIAQGRFDEAEALVEPYLASVRALDDPKLLDARRELVALAFQGEGEYERAVRVWRAVVADKERLHGDDAAELIPALLALGAAEADATHWEEAEATFGRARDLLQRERPGDLEAMGEVHFALGHLQLSRGNRGRAEGFLRESVENFSLAEPAGNPQYAAALTELGLLRMEQGDLDAACDLLRRGIDVAEREFGTSPDVIPGLVMLSSCEARRGNLEEAEAISRRALLIAERGGAPPGTMARLLSVRAQVLRAQGRDAEAEEVEKRMRSLGADARAMPDGR